MDHRQYRRLLKQKLFTIRRYTEGDEVELNEELRDLKEFYENIPGFTSWSLFPEGWDIGDPAKVKEYAFNEVDMRNLQRAFGKDYTEIVFKEKQRVPDNY
jgi:hypothetical protein